MLDVAELTGTWPWRGAGRGRDAFGDSTVLKRSNCFVPGSLLKGLTDSPLKCDLRCSTLPLLKGMLQQKLQYPEIPQC